MSWKQTYQPVRILRKSYAKLGLGTQVRYSQLKLRNFAESNIYLILVKSLIDCGCSVASVDWAVVVGLILVSESALNGFSLAYLFMTQGTQPMKVGAFTVAKIRPPQHPGLWRPKQNHESSMHVYSITAFPTGLKLLSQPPRSYQVVNSLQTLP